MEFSTLLAHVWQVSETALVNFVLSGDNALVIAMATLRLPKQTRKKAVWIGTVVAVGLRIILTLLVGRALLFPFVQAIGGLLLAYIALSLLLPTKESEQSARPASGLLSAIGVITMADVAMSLDNVVALAGVAAGSEVTLVLGLVISITLIMFASAWMADILARFRWLQVIGSGVLAWTAGGMIAHDPGVSQWLPVSPLYPLLGTMAAVGLVYGFLRLFRYSE
ncbi:MAG: YjbE family putative metal transport protein [Firmicutes bacterium]|nr:YjbE family putative metal transport protein [Bacillota bacterium]